MDGRVSGIPSWGACVCCTALSNGIWFNVRYVAQLWDRWNLEHVGAGGNPVQIVTSLGARGERIRTQSVEMIWAACVGPMLYPCTVGQPAVVTANMIAGNSEERQGCA